MGCAVSTKPEAVSTKPEVDKANEDNSVSTSPSHFGQIDEYAKNAPESAGHSVETLVDYLSTVAKEPVLLVRAFFVWITHHIWYDTDGYFGRSTNIPGDSESVLKNGKAVCEGYANLLEALCRQVDIPVKKIYGYAKGFSYSADDPFTTSMNTNHAWNAIRMHEKWYLIDCTWGAGHLDESREFKKEFDEFYFLTNPEHLITSHFPYMDNDMKASRSWQLVDKPITLEEFNIRLKYFPEAFKLGVKPVSHKDVVIEMENEVTVVFDAADEDIILNSSLWYKGGNTLYEKQRQIFDFVEDNIYKVRVHPHKHGIFFLRIFGGKQSAINDSEIPQLFQYVIMCKKVEDSEFEFPETLTQAHIDRCRLLEPIRNNLQGNSSVFFKLTSPYLEEVMVNKNFLQKNGATFDGFVTTGSPGTSLTIYGSRETYGNLPALYNFEIT